MVSNMGEARSQSPPSFVGQNCATTHANHASISVEPSSLKKDNSPLSQKKSVVTHTFDDEFEDLLDNELLEAPPKVRDLYDEELMGVGVAEDDND